MDDDNYTYPDSSVGAGFSESEKKRWDRNLKKLIQKIDGKFGSSKKRGRPPKKKQNG